MLLATGSVFAQEVCYLGVGSGSDEKIIEVFKLTDAQIEKMKNWGAELKYRNSFLEEQAKNLLKQHSESPPEQLLKMSHKYKVLLDSIQKNMHMIDQRMLSQFSKDQYNLYIKLCNQVSRTPIFAEPQVNEK
ncbi:MAG: hypothetical protein CMH48_10430 [Muricauda sp.]|nr:hypothetical protein [Allomuricauda sp.]|tara:strand:+ start:80424 stop:80819 length:396 start_codon:yes stop_codon:yes gene_type:complete